MNSNKKNKSEKFFPFSLLIIFLENEEKVFCVKQGGKIRSNFWFSLSRLPGAPKVKIVGIGVESDEEIISNLNVIS